MVYGSGGEITDNITMLIKKSRKSYDVDSNIGADNIDIDLEFEPPVSRPPYVMLTTMLTQVLPISHTGTFATLQSVANKAIAIIVNDAKSDIIDSSHCFTCRNSTGLTISSGMRRRLRRFVVA